MTKLPSCPLWHQSINWMVTGEPRDCDPGMIDMEQAYASIFDEPRPVHRMTVDEARAELLDRIETGEAIATGQRCEAIGVHGFTTRSLPEPIEASAWPNLRIDDQTSFAELARLEVSIPGQGYANVRLRRADVMVALEAVQRRKAIEEAVQPRKAIEEAALVGLLSLGAPGSLGEPVQDTGESPRERAKRHEREAKEYLDGRVAGRDACSEELPAADPMWREMPGAPDDKVSRGKFRTLYALTVPAGLRRRRGRPRP